MSLSLVLADESPRHFRECREGRGFSPATENGISSGALAPEATWLRGLKARLVGLLQAAGLKPRPSKAPRYDRVLGHRVRASCERLPGSFATLRMTTLRFCLLLLLVGSIVFSAHAEVLDRVVASIGEVAVTQSDVEREYRLERFLDGQWPPPAPDAKALDLARERLTYQKLLLEEETQDLSRDPALEKTATEELAGVRQRFPSEKDFQAALGALHMDEKQVLTTLVDQQRILRVIEERLRPEAAPATPQVETYYRDVFTPEYTRTRGLPVPPLTEVLGQIQEILVQQKINQLLADWLAELRPSRRVQFYGAVTSDK